MKGSSSFIFQCLGRYAWANVLVAFIGAQIQGCAKLMLATPRVIDGGSYLVHVVSSSNDDFETILLWYTGSEDSARAVQSVNPGLNVAGLTPGTRILIPEALLTHTNPMPAKRVNFREDQEPRRLRSSSAPPRRAVSTAKKKDALESMLEESESRRNRSGKGVIEPSRPPSSKSEPGEGDNRSSDPQGDSQPRSSSLEASPDIFDDLP